MELSGEFVDAVVEAAERVLGAGDVCRGEAMLRRAQLLASQLGEDVKATVIARRLATTRPVRPAPTPLALDREVVEVVLQHTLMRWQPARLDYEGSGDRAKRWLVLAPAAWCADAELLRRRVGDAVTAIFADTNARLHRAEPLDANYLGITSVQHRVLDAAALLAEPWREIAAHKIWEPSTTFVVDDGRWYASAPSDFVPMALITLVLRGALTAAALVDRLADLGFTRAKWEERMKDPAGELRAALDYYVS
jgi:hypothetical protein